MTHIDSALHDRLRSAAGDRTYRHLGELTGMNPETVRRYMQGQAPSVEFLTRLCEALQINGAWLLTGEGPMRRADVTSHALDRADASELLSAMANTITSLIDRVERLEVFVQTMEAHLRAANNTPGSSRADPSRGLPTDGQANTAGETRAEADTKSGAPARIGTIPEETAEIVGGQPVSGNGAALGGPSTGTPGHPAEAATNGHASHNGHPAPTSPRHVQIPGAPKRIAAAAAQRSSEAAR